MSFQPTTDGDSIETDTRFAFHWAMGQGKEKGSFGYVYDFMYQQTSDGEIDFLLPLEYSNMRHGN